MAVAKAKHVEKRSAQTIQKVFRGYLTRRDVNELRWWIAEDVAASTIQSICRGFVARRRATHARAARSIQKTWRCYTVHVDYILSLLSAIALQAAIRRHLARKSFSLTRMAVSCIQAAGRSYLARTRMDHFAQSAARIQSMFRMHRALASRRFMIAAATSIQSCARMFLVRRQRSRDRDAARSIQRIWRGYAAYASYVWSNLAAVKIQSSIRGCIARLYVEHVRAELLADTILAYRSATLIQRVFREFQTRFWTDYAVTVIQKAVRNNLSRRSFARLRLAVVRIQSLYRGKRIRRKRGKKLVAHVLRLERATKKSHADPSLRLGNRALVALNIVQTSSSLSEIMAAVCTLELATRYSENCCIAFANSGAADVLFSLIRTCNRSLPHVELVHFILLCMWNVAQHDVALPSLATLTGVEVFLDLIQMFRDKDQVFCLAVYLLERVAHGSIEFQHVCSTRENMKRLRAVHSLCVRKLSLSSGYTTSTRSSTRSGLNPSLKEGVRMLQKVIKMVGYN